VESFGGEAFTGDGVRRTGDRDTGVVGRQFALMGDVWIGGGSSVIGEAACL
jgi:hypothetical protein